MDSKEQKIKQLERNILKWVSIDAIPTIALGLGFGAKFSDKGTFLHPIFDNGAFVSFLIGFGVIGMAFCAIKLLPLFKEKKSLEESEG